MEKKKNNFLIHGGILAMAGIIVRIIGMLYRIPVVNIIGSEGNGIYGIAFNVYNIMLVLSSYGLPMAVSKLVSQRFAEGKYKNAKRIFKYSLTIGIVTGGIAAALVFFGADFIENVIYSGNTPGLAIPLRILAPTIFLVAVLGVIRGFFQGQGTMIPTAVSQIIEQIVNAIVSIGAGYILMQSFKESANQSAYGAAGSTLGTALGALSALIFMIFLYFVYKPQFKKLLRKDTKADRVPASNMYKIIITTMIPIILGQTFYQISSVFDDILFSNLSSTVIDSVTIDLGTYSSCFILLIGIPQGVASAMSASMLPAMVTSFTEKDIDGVRTKLTKTIKTNLFIAIPSFIGLAVLGQGIIKILFSSYNSAEGATMLKIGAVSVVFFTLSTVTSSALQAIDKMKMPVYHSAISFLIHIVLVYFMLRFTSLGIYGLVIGSTLFPLVVFILNLKTLYQEINYRFSIKKIVLKPLISAIIMGVCIAVVYNGLLILTESNIVSMFFALVVAAITYFGPYYLLTKHSNL